jgi:hypothetical protein
VHTACGVTLFPYLFRRRNFDVVARQLPAAPFRAMSLANSVLGFIGVAPDTDHPRSAHQALSFGTDHLFVFRSLPLIGKHGGIARAFSY